MFLLDANLLIALGDANHPSREAAKKWFLAHRSKGWATCPLTENAFLRIVGHAAYPKGPGSPEKASALLRALTALPGHHFWPDEISLLDAKHFPSFPDASPTELTDIYLLALAASRSAKFVTFDSRIRADIVKHGPSHLQILRTT